MSARGPAGDRACVLVGKATNRAAVVRTWAVPLMSYRAVFDSEPDLDGPPPGRRHRDPDLGRSAVQPGRIKPGDPIRWLD